MWIELKVRERRRKRKKKKREWERTSMTGGRGWTGG